MLNYSDISLVSQHQPYCYEVACIVSYVYFIIIFKYFRNGPASEKKYRGTCPKGRGRCGGETHGNSPEIMHQGHAPGTKTGDRVGFGDMCTTTLREMIRWVWFL